MPKSDLTKQTGSRKRDLTIMIFKRVGKVREFTISSVLILCASLFLLFYIVATIYFTNKYFDTHRANKIQAAQIAKLSRELEKATESLRRSKRHIALLEDYFDEGRAEGFESESKVAGTELPEVLGIEDLKVERGALAVDVAFRIVNRQPNEEPIEGYIFVLARVRDSDDPQAWAYPRSPLREGLPVDYRDGHRFFIYNFMSISCEVRLGEWIDEPLLLEILVYDRDGRLILRRVAESENTSSSSDI